MFTGIVSDVGTIAGAEQRADLRLTVRCGYEMSGIGLGSSICCSGVCLTVVDKGDDWFAADVSAETLARTAPDSWRSGARINLERSLKVGDELGGHFVTGHVDCIGTIVDIRSDGGSNRLVIAIPDRLAALVAAKGSVTLDGVSLTINEVEAGGDGKTHFSVNIIPHTGACTTFSQLAISRQLNVEIDVLARYVDRMISARAQ